MARRKKRRIIKVLQAILYVVIGIAGIIALTIAIIAMWCSSTFLPVYIGSTYVIGNQIVRYELYTIMFIFIVLFCALVNYAGKFLFKKR